jgi:hypothetical protein
MCTVAVELGRHKELVARVRAINGELADPSKEIFKAATMKDYGTGLTRSDMAQFLDWLLGPSEEAVKSFKRIKEKLEWLRRVRLATFHVMCENGKVPPGQRM